MILDVTVKVLPLLDADEPVPNSTHWLFCSVLELLGLIGPSQSIPASLIKKNLFTRLSYMARQPLARLWFGFDDMITI